MAKISCDHTNYLNDLERNMRERYEITSNPPTLSRPQTDDVIFGHAVVPEFMVGIEFPEYKKPSLKARIKYRWLRFTQKIARLILWLSNKIGDKNV